MFDWFWDIIEGDDDDDDDDDDFIRHSGWAGIVEWPTEDELEVVYDECVSLPLWGYKGGRYYDTTTAK